MELNITSTVIKSARYNREHRELLLTFPNGAQFAYLDVDYVHVLNLESAHSAGAYVNRNIKGQHKSVHLDAPRVPTPF